MSATLPPFSARILAAGITGEIVYVDNGFSSVGMSFPAEGGDAG